MASGKKIRLAFRGNKVIEVKKQGGEAHLVNRSTKGSPAFTNAELQRGYRIL